MVAAFQGSAHRSAAGPGRWTLTDSIGGALCGDRPRPPGLEYLLVGLLDVSAGAFPLQSRLHGVRRELLITAPSHGGVKRCALNWGFWHLGRFAADYRRRFGESPKVTLFRAVDS
ncbi:MAG: hypothetical protein RLZZ282_427 [Verrucomicrobiota bacterium]|jgi:AraC-like DNA-binding protein